MLLYVHRNRRLISKDGRPRRPPRLWHSSWALIKWDVSGLPHEVRVFPASLLATRSFVADPRVAPPDTHRLPQPWCSPWPWPQHGPWAEVPASWRLQPTAQNKLTSQALLATIHESSLAQCVVICSLYLSLLWRLKSSCSDVAPCVFLRLSPLTVCPLPPPPPPTARERERKRNKQTKKKQ